MYLGPQQSFLTVRAGREGKSSVRLPFKVKKNKNKPLSLFFFVVLFFLIVIKKRAWREPDGAQRSCVITQRARVWKLTGAEAMLTRVFHEGGRLAHDHHHAGCTTAAPIPASGVATVCYHPLDPSG